MAAWIQWINSYLWGWPMVLLLGSVHLYMTVRTGFIQRKLFLAIRLSFSRGSSAAGEVSPFAALATALASTIGTGSIVGVGTAIALGGPGAVLWMWLTGILCIATKYSESLIGIKYRMRTKDGSMLGGAMYALSQGLGCPWAGALFAALTVLASFGVGCAVQANAVSSMVQANFGLPLWSSGLVMTLLAGWVMLGKAGSVSRVCTALVPLMSGFYLLGCLLILYWNRAFLGQAIALICSQAFAPAAAGGGLTGYGVTLALRYGMARGLFSNEAGMGSAPIVDATAQTPNAPRQALVSASAVFWDTVVICAITGLVITCRLIAAPELFPPGMNGALLTAKAFAQIPVLGPLVLVGGMLTFAFSSILGWSFYGERCVEYLVGVKGLLPYRLLYLAVLFIGSLAAVSLIWDIADGLNALMVLPNVAAVLLLSPQIARETRYYVYGNRIEEQDPTPIPLIKK